MRLLNEQYQEIHESDIDLSLGEVVETTIIKLDAVPIDDIEKFVWDDDDYETVRIYRLFTEEELERQNELAKPTSEERIEALETALLEMMGVNL